MATPTPFTFAGQLGLPSDPSLPGTPAIPFNFADSANAQGGGVFNVTGSGSVVVPFSGIAYAKAVLVRYDAQTGAQPITLALNGTNPVSLPPGGMFLWFAPSPTAGLSSLTIAHTASCQIRVWVLG